MDFFIAFLYSQVETKKGAMIEPMDQEELVKRKIV